MKHRNHVNLIQEAVLTKKSIWADFGSGKGAFTLALADILGEKGKIYSIEKDGVQLEKQKKIFKKKFPKTNILFVREDFRGMLDLPQLDGIVMANSLHFYTDKIAILKKVKNYLRPFGRFILVEYNTDVGHLWAPYPVSFHSFCDLVESIGFFRPTLLKTLSSQHGEIYAAHTFVS